MSAKGKCECGLDIEVTMIMSGEAHREVHKAQFEAFEQEQEAKAAAVQAAIQLAAHVARYCNKAVTLTDNGIAYMCPGKAVSHGLCEEHAQAAREEQAYIDSKIGRF